ncbi:hypothetical protein PPERSA_05858 [Pseudocohnilembus persalinus]|uniref:Uncharacterized protein n=1 Tax=Pseudocohnilembus persalinus TaxID=266149 RepID=A0A0V0R4M7_PSEPJ|nr:hypothetical protein PPERSA_05858 [Pseudocohnilembus persalinus]|eukprot:KRX09189.1 hypothetical protein PPERSA_05858 [Pseudocohnilembus persalinus]
MSTFVSNPIENIHNQSIQSRKGEISMILGKTSNKYAQTLSTTKKSNLQVLERTIEDEVLLTELALDRKDLIIYDINPSIVLSQDIRNDSCVFKGFLDENNKEFFIEISEQQKDYFTKSFFLQLCDVAEELGAIKIYACLRNSESKNIGQILGEK